MTIVCRCGSLLLIAREQFAYRETEELLKTLDSVTRVSGVSRGQAFEDFLHMTVCALSGGAMEEQYLGVVAKHTAGKKGKRGCDRIAQMLAELVTIMEETRKDILGDLFQGAITYGEAGQFYTPEPVTELMARLTLGDEADETERKTVCDPCCGSGRMLLAIAEKHPQWEFVGQDIDLRCVRMAAINLALWNRRGHVIWGNTLSCEQKLIYETGFNLRGFIHEVKASDRSPAVQQLAADRNAAPQEVSDASEDAEPRLTTALKRQLFLFDEPDQRTK